MALYTKHYLFFLFLLLIISCKNDSTPISDTFVLYNELSDASSYELDHISINISEFCIEDFEVLGNEEYLIVGSVWSPENNEDLCIARINNSGSILWNSVTGNHGHDQGRFISRTKHDQFLIGGFTYDTLEYKEIYLQKSNGKGTLWEKKYHIQYGVADEAYNVLELANGDMLLMGFTKANIDAFLLRINPRGKIKHKVKTGSKHKDYLFDAIEFDNGDIIAAGVLGGFHDATGNDFTVADADGFIIKTDKGLNEIWRKKIDFGAHDFVKKIIPSKHNDFFVFGSSQKNNGSGFDYLLAKYDTSGQMNLFKRFGNDSWDYGEDILILNDNLILLGTSYEEKSVINVFKTDFDGTIKEKYTIKHPFDLEAKKIHSINGNLYICGNIIEGNNSKKGFILKLKSS